jgi:acyl-homoserine lactone synthase
MLHIVTSENRHLYQDELEQSFRLRYRVFVQERKWKNLRRPDEREVDQFDNDEAIYLLALEGKDRQVIGGCRLLPTTGPYLLPDVFPELSEGLIPRAANIFEWGRLYVSPSRREGLASNKTSCLIMAGVMEYCLAEGIDQLVAISEAYWIPRFLELRLNPRPLGLPRQIERTSTLCYTLEPSEIALEKLRLVHGFAHSVLVRTGIEQPAVRHRAEVNTATARH